MERVSEKENQKSKINRIISWVLIVFSLIALAFCVHQIVSLIIQENKNKTLKEDWTKTLETFTQDNAHLKEEFSVLTEDGYYSVYIEGDYQYVDGSDEPITIID